MGGTMDENDKYTLLRMELVKMLGYDLMGQLDASDEELVEKIGKRLMPEGMEWPRFEDGEPVRFGDVVSDGDETGRVYYVTFDTVNPVIIGFTDETPDQDPGTWLEVSVNDGERVKRPEAKVLDADGAEIRKGDTVYHVKDGSEMTVYGIEGEWLVASVGGRVRHDVVTHRAPVLAADGKPLREGETVYEVKGAGHAYEVVSIRIGDGDPLTPTVVTCDVGDGTSEHFLPGQLTHERPDSWERLEDDADALLKAESNGKGSYNAANDYCNAHGLGTDGTVWVLVARDLVRRAKKLAGVSE